MEKENLKFNALTPEVLDKNKEIYTKALDFAFDNKDIKNIAITGIYGAGKSTVWNTYVKETKKENIITVSLGKYEDNIDENDIKLEDEENSSEHFLDNENRVERQIINQILSQINAKDIPLSKYGFKSNKSCCTILFETFAMLGIICSVLLWINRESIVDNTGFSYMYVLISCIIMLFLSLLYIFYRYFRENILRISKVKFRGAEADLGYNEKNDETVLDRDIKELVYLIKSSNSKIIVFEDLDRYDNISIYTKLRELNFLLNKYSKTNENENKNENENESIKFVYMLRDGIFKSKNRTKFFDYIIPIVPIVDSKNSESMMVNLLGDLNSLIDDRLIFKISLYIDDMRLIKNIINEFIIYKDIINIDGFKLSNDKLFSLIILKNIFPYEFDLLQLNTGYLYDVITKIEGYKNEEWENTKERIKNYQKEYNSKVNDITDEKILNLTNILKESIKMEMESLQLYNIKNKDDKNDSFEADINECDKDFIINKTMNKDLSSYCDNQNINYNEICNFLIKINLNEKILNSDKLLMSIISVSKIEKVFEIKQKTHNFKYLSLVRVLVLQGYIDKTYWHYKGYFYKGSLGINDIIFIKNINESKEQDHLLDIENPSKIINRLEKIDFNRFNILNKKLLKYCVEENKIEYTLSIINSVNNNRNYIKLAEILESYKLIIIENLINILYSNNIYEIKELLEVSKDYYFNTYNNILIAIYTNEHIDTKTIKKFNLYLENNWKVVSFLPEDRKDIFYNNISNVGVKFIDLQGDEINTDIIKNIESLNAYKLCVKNIVYIIEKILGKSVQYGNLLSEIYNSSLLECKNYIDNNFESFLNEYIDGNNNEDFTNDEKILIKILNSKISNEYKIKYLNLNNTELTNISDIINDFKNEDLLNCMFDRDIILFTKDNVKIYYDNIEKSSKKFIDYVERNLNESNVDEILKGNSDMCNEFINNPELRDGLFEYIYKYATKPVKTIDSNLSKERINLLIKRELIEINYKNINFLLEKNWKEVIIMWVNSTENDIQDEFVDVLLYCKLEEKEDLIYKLINSKITDENSMKLVDLLGTGVLIEKINLEKENLISYIIDRGLSGDNINYICKNFNKFSLMLKEGFIKYLKNYNVFHNLQNDNLNDDVMTFILNFEGLETYIKIDLICKKIDNDTDVLLLRKYIESVKEISKLAEVWENNYPELETDEEKKIGNKLLEKGIVKQYREGYPIKIFISKDKKGKSGVQ
ncbi:YobI family P-loop NTPase [Parvimonas micra]|uniref:YobI-like P-loop NTPase domain-containing protein n=1 Tax=Parvimonas micra ATCC 33270 TaxID=411465 RepID=A8SL26_9FIRM|nr:hypothetical protein [Parvimonas micra]EDP24269.1 hypothetical protein PEPMIC_00851 [Parvimonas micra ATCC 33270]RSB90515.1 hypothetical protein EGS00_01775 [Parvimonas micra]VEH97225.1 Uncharacterised protein [Parvimonas micra]